MHHQVVRAVRKVVKSIIIFISCCGARSKQPGGTSAMDDEFEELKEFINTLSNDITECAEFLDSHRDSQVMRRAFIRAVLASTEGCIYLMKQNTLKSHNKQV